MPARKVPTRILRARGSRVAKDRVDEPQIDPGVPEPAFELRGKAKQIWDDLSERLVDAGVLTPIDGGALTRYAHLSAKWQELAALDVDDLDEAQEKRHERVLRQISNHLLAIEKQFGMTPSTRASIPRLDKPARVTSRDKTRFLDGGK